jgi:uncharacterized protein HemY
MLLLLLLLVVLLLLLLVVLLLLLVVVVVGVVAGALRGWGRLAGGARACAGLLDGAQSTIPGAVRRGVTPGGERE